MAKSKKRKRRAKGTNHCKTHYGASGTCTGGPSHFINSTGAKLFFYSLVSGETISFDAFITDFTESFEPSFEEYEVYGRMDPITIFKNTKRQINLSWSVVGVHYEEMVRNLYNVQRYIQTLYPSYNDYDGKESLDALSLSSPPLLKLSFMNLISDSGNRSSEVNFTSNKKFGRIRSFSFKGTSEVKNSGLLVVPSTLTVNPEIVERGAVLLGTSKNDKSRAAIPREISLTTSFRVLHQHKLGYDEKRNKFQKFDIFPYSVVSGHTDA